jgi:hypothetical protein
MALIGTNFRLSRRNKELIKTFDMSNYVKRFSYTWGRWGPTLH